MRLAVTRLLLPAAIVVLLAAACGTPPGVASGTPAPSDVASQGAGAASGPGASGAPATDVWLPEWANGDTPEEVANRRPLPFCGIEQAPAPQPGIFIDRAVRLCFWTAHLAGTEAEFVSVQSTIEGAPIATIYRLAADGTVEVLTDFTQDAFGGGTWIASTCSEVVEGEGDELLGVSDCDDGAPLD